MILILLLNYSILIFSADICVFPFKYGSDFYDSCDMVGNITIDSTLNHCFSRTVVQDGALQKLV